MKKISIITFLFILLALPLCAQRDRRAVARQKTSGVSAAELKLFKTMVPATAKLMFIDSVVVDKDKFLSLVPLNSESGSLSVTNAKADFANQLTAYENELGDRRVYADGDSTKTMLYTQTMLGNAWSKGHVIKDFGHEEYQKQNFPFLSADGVTLYFSATGPESMGGRDIFMSSFDSDNASWYKPQNIGLPYNSTANDYLLAIDDLDTLGWLVTDRRQPAGKVCIYTFVPTTIRQNFDEDDLEDDEILPYARIMSIRSTWKFGNRKAALKRRDSMLARTEKKHKDKNAIFFVVNDNRVITSPSQFKSDRSRLLFKQIVELKQMRKNVSSRLDAARRAFHNGNRGVANDIRIMEKQQAQNFKDINNLEKTIRKIELNGNL